VTANALLLLCRMTGLASIITLAAKMRNQQIFHDPVKDNLVLGHFVPVR